MKKALFRIRRQQELEAIGQLSQKERTLQNLIRKHQTLSHELDELHRHISRQQKQPLLSPAELAEYAEYGQLLNQQIVHQQILIDKTARSLERHRKKLADARQKKKIVENLQQREEAEWKKTLQKNEKALLDEFRAPHRLSIRL
jgi:flagellar export protein FliJ